MLFARSVVNIPRYYNPPVSRDSNQTQSKPNLGLHKIGLGTDIAGGPSSSLWTNMRLAIVQDRVLSFQNMSEYPAHSVPGLATPPSWLMTHTYAYHLATIGGAATVGMDDLLGIFEVGKLFDAFLVDWAIKENDQAFDIPRGNEPDTYTEETQEQWEERVKGGWEHFVMGGDDR